MKKLIFLLFIVVSCNPEQIQEVTLTDTYTEPGPEAIQGLEQRSPDYCVCDFISIDLPVIDGLTNFVFTWNPLHIPRTQFYWSLYKFTANGWENNPTVSGAWNFLNDYCVEKSNAPRHLLGAASGMCDGYTYRMDCEMWVKPYPNAPNYEFCEELSEVFIYTTYYKPAGCIAVR